MNKQIHDKIKAIQLYILLSQGSLFNPRLSEMIQQLKKMVENE